MDVFVQRPLIAFLVMMASGLSGCSGRHDAKQSGSASQVGAAGEVITIKGSDTMVILAQTWAQRFMALHPNVVLQVSGGGTGTGLAALVNGTADIATASRPIKDRERKQVNAATGQTPHETKAALDALAVYVHVDNPVRTLALPQLKQIFRGRAKNWASIGGENRPFVLYSRENNSGTYAYFKEHVLDDEDFAAEAQTLPGTAAVINAVSRDRGGVGYGGIAYAGGVRAVLIPDSNGTPVGPSLENAVQGRYPLSRFLYFYTRGEPKGASREFLTWIRTPEGQALVSSVGFYPIGAPHASRGSTAQHALAARAR
jgi:phosphate transport system substrate-binding protein